MAFNEYKVKEFNRMIFDAESLPATLLTAEESEADNIDEEIDPCALDSDCEALVGRMESPTMEDLLANLDGTGEFPLYLTVTCLIKILKTLIVKIIE